MDAQRFFLMSAPIEISRERIEFAPYQPVLSGRWDLLSLYTNRVSLPIWPPMWSSKRAQIDNYVSGIVVTHLFSGSFITLREL